jgi:hypothetical protein
MCNVLGLTKVATTTRRHIDALRVQTNNEVKDLAKQVGLLY